ncbi:hypothetical protein HY212_03810 [Candidatus Pacearchaeota archaeon]|nr:hypothetical protein [Candidatus Pacearchaeota archaeon]
MEKLEESERMVKAIDHLLYVTYPLVKDKRMLLKILVETRKAIANCINSILQYEYLKKQIELSRDSKTNLKTFIEKCSQKYNISEKEIKEILDLFEIVESHKQSPFEFVKGAKIVILSENMAERYLTIDKTKEFLFLAKDMLKKTKEKLS